MPAVNSVTKPNSGVCVCVLFVCLCMCVLFVCLCLACSGDGDEIFFLVLLLDVAANFYGHWILLRSLLFCLLVVVTFVVVYLFVFSFICLFVCLFVCLCVCCVVRLFVCVSQLVLMVAETLSTVRARLRVVNRLVFFFYYLFIFGLCVSGVYFLDTDMREFSF